ncbi:type VII toxin-antitoxin system MntA family adenylyltransferase antitoxin [Desulfosarcina ovata]|uniref:type VII toxin-antitoxin system MntA family adenylyltransferase antitoxin n=1 Tax=Desulfosarcina ovata TaxID=83564 RepID=UPI0015665431|nr:nucleotidyltransferase domain-containing protein [Desulfosarcina ovata]
MPDDVLTRIPSLVNSLAGAKDVAALYSFGSLAKNKLGPLSDLDFGILISPQVTKKECIDKQLELVGVFTESLKTEEVDLVFMNHAPLNIAFQILKTGKLLLCNDRRSLIDFRENVVRSYLDFCFIRDAFDSVFLKGIGYHG